LYNINNIFLLPIEGEFEMGMNLPNAPYSSFYVQTPSAFGGYGQYPSSPSFGGYPPTVSMGQSLFGSSAGLPTASNNPMVDYYNYQAQYFQQLQPVLNAQQQMQTAYQSYYNSIYTSQVTMANAINQAENDLLKAGSDGVKNAAEAVTAVVDTMKSMKASAMEMGAKAPVGGGGAGE
jgi:hypothetical protein